MVEPGGQLQQRVQLWQRGQACGVQQCQAAQPPQAQQQRQRSHHLQAAGKWVIMGREGGILFTQLCTTVTGVHSVATVTRQGLRLAQNSTDADAVADAVGTWPARMTLILLNY